LYNQKSLIDAVLDIYRNCQAYISGRTSKLGIGRGQWYILNRLITGGDGISQERLSAELFIDSSHTTRALKKLEDDGFIYRQQDPADARKKSVYVSEKGLSVKSEYIQSYRDLNEVFTKGFTPEEERLAKELLSRMRSNLTKYLTDNNS
jgi:DNA-binding MarR family transcriptional regulator